MAIATAMQSGAYALVVPYYASAAWTHELVPETQKTRRPIIERFRARHGEICAK